MHLTAFYQRRARLVNGLVLALVLALTTTLVAAAATLVQISADPFTNPDSQHATEVEPDTFSNGSTIVSAVQQGRFVVGGGSSDIGWATSTDGGNTWQNGSLPCITQYNFSGCSGVVKYDRVSDPSVAFDAKFGVWIISTLPIKSGIGAGVLVSRSTDGLNWSNPVTVHTSGDFHDKDWIACDNTSTSPFYGNCYVEWDDNSLGNRIEMNTSTDGGLTWSVARTPGSATGIGGQPLVQPNGTVVVPIDNAFEGSVLSFTSTNGGSTWNTPVTVSVISSHGDAGNLRSGPLPSAEIDGDGKVYVVWSDCRFRVGCAENDIVMSTSTDGTTWSAVTRIPIDRKKSTVDHFIPGIAVDSSTHAPNVHIALTYYYYPTSNCSVSTCKLDVGYIASINGGSTWIKPKQKLAGPMNVTWLASTDQGYMVGDYISTSFSNGKAIPAFANATAPVGGVFNEDLFSVMGGLSVPAGGEVVSSAGDVPVPGAHSDHPLPTAPVNTIDPIH